MEAAPKNLFFFELCRLCLENAGARDIFETSNLPEDIYNCTGVKVASSDNFPSKICIKCSVVVANSKELRLVASKNDAHLRILFGGVQDEYSKGDIIQTSTNSTCKSPSVPESKCSDVKSIYFDNSPKHNNQNSSKEKRSSLLKEGEENGTETFPVIRQCISLRKDLFPPSLQTLNPEKVEVCPDLRLLQCKVEAESPRKKMKIGDDDDEDANYICSICCKVFDKYKKLYLHQRLHNKKIYCPLDACGKKFATKGDLEKHLRTHTGEKPFLCNICEKGFTQRGSLRTHITTVHSKRLKEPNDEDDIDENSSSIENSQG